MHLNVFLCDFPAATRKYNTEETAEEATAPQLNEKEMDHSVASRSCRRAGVTQCELLYDAYMPLVVDQMKRAIPQLRYQCEKCAR